MSTENKISQMPKEHKCVMAQIKPETDYTPWKKISELSSCPFGDDNSSMDKTNKRVANQKRDKPGVTGKEHVPEPNMRSTTIKGEKKALAEKQVDIIDLSKGKDNGDVVDVIGGTSGIVLANSVMLFMTMLLINLLLLP